MSWAEAHPLRVTTPQFFAMLDAEIFPREMRVGLWDGVIYEKMAKTQWHAVTGMMADDALHRHLPQGWCISNENPVGLTEEKAPLPDMTVLRGRPADYVRRRPGPEDVGLIVEFAYSSLREDEGEKLAAYARAGIPAYWVLDIRGGAVRAYSGPIAAETRYGSSHSYGFGESVPLALGGGPAIAIPVEELLPHYES